MTLLETVLNPWFWFQPVFYSLHGWIATEMALWMLFHPYEPKFIPFTRLQIPFTPGIFPRGRKKLSVSIANTITDLLLTEEDIHRQTERIVTEENIYKAIDSISGSIYRELQDVTHLRRIYRYLDDVLPSFAEGLVTRLVENLREGDQSAALQAISQFISHILGKIQLSQSQADRLANLVLTDLLPADAIRQGLVCILSEENSYRIQQSVRKRIQGWQGFFLRFVDLQDALIKARDYLRDNPNAGNAMVAELTVELKLKEKLADFLVALPLHRLDMAHSPLVDMIKQGLIDHQLIVAQAISGLSGDITQAITAQLLRLDLPWVKWLPPLKRDAAKFIYTYLHRELAHLIGKALPAISLKDVIIDKIDRFSAQELENTIQRICRNELRTLAYLGAFLGFWLGLVSNLVSLKLH
jgi:uncharacterized membrane protein YheB (UPF0754 family)